MDLVLFDIDGTLLTSRGAGRESLDVAFEAVHGWAAATAGLSLAGATDGGIVRDVARRFGVTAESIDLARVQARYYEALEERLAEPGRARACAGVHALVERLRGTVHLGLLTGNWREGARRKLAAIGMEEGWEPGAFGDDAVDRDALVPVARARARAAGLEVARVIVVGDTPADVSCARAGGAIAVAVETGFATREALRAAGPDLLLPDLERGGPWFEALLGVSFPARTG